MRFDLMPERANLSPALKSLGAGALFAALAVNSPGAAAIDELHSFDSGKFTLNCSGNCPKVSTKYARAGKYSMESTISNSSSNKKRTEAVIPGTAKFMEFNRDYWIGFSIYLPAGWQVPDNMELLAQIHRSTTGGGQPPLALYTGSGEWKLTSQEWGGKKDWFLNSVYEDVGRWTDFVIHYKPSYTSSGVLEVWKDGGLVAKRNGANTAKDSKGPYFKLGIYKSQYNAPSKTVYHDELRIASGPGAGYEDVAPGNFASGSGSSSGSGSGSSSGSGSDSGSGSSSGSGSGGDSISLQLNDGQTITRDMVVVADAQDSDGIAKVKFYVNGTKVTVDGSAPYSFNFDANPYFGEDVKIIATLVDRDGNKVNDEVTVKVRR